MKVKLKSPMHIRTIGSWKLVMRPRDLRKDWAQGAEIFLIGLSCCEW